MGKLRATGMSKTKRPKIGLIAGWGRYPVQVAHALERSGYAVYCVGIAGHADKSLARWCTDFRLLGLARMGSHIRYFRRHGVNQATMAGKIHKILLFQRGFIRNHFPDLICTRTFFPHFISGTKNRNDDALLTAAIDGYGRHGVQLQAATALIPELLVKYGQLSGNRLSPGQRRDVEYAWNIAKEMGRLDIGQAVAVKGRAVLAVEAVEGTDQCIRRAGLLCPTGGFTVVKVAKPAQDMRFDVPTIGVGTVQSMLQAGGKVLIVEADKTVIVDEPEVIRFANRHRISIVAVHEGQIAEDFHNGGHVKVA